MTATTTLKYFGWSAFSISSDKGNLHFDPFFRPYCGAEWYHLEDFADAKYICLTHGHEEHFLDVPVVAKRTGAKVISSPGACKFLRKRNGLPDTQLIAIDPHAFGTVDVPGFKISALPWQHRDVNVPMAVLKAIFKGNTTQLKWAWSSATNAPFLAPYTGFHLTLPNGIRILNYNEGLNSKMTDREINDLGNRFQTDVLIGGMQMNFVDDVIRGIAALKPKVVVLFSPHEKLFEMIEVKSAPNEVFERAVRERFPNIQTYIAQPGFELELAADTVPA